ncbi:MAG TPA: ABC transporter ATP-binding protein [Candidatus Rubrimentiphilum sp.]|nr:ABC transporter ATP-binding protein [Candidatus Rubrimentiphilum sp.]
MRALAVNSVTKEYGSVHALDGVSFEIAPGEMVALVGPSGCGKSTLLNLAGCIDLPTSGSVLVDGHETSRLNDDALTALRRDRIGTVFQFFNLLPAMTVAGNVALPLILQRCPQHELDRRVQEALEAVGIADKAAAYPSQLSGGQAQRAAVARAIIHKPALVLADEPTGNLDSHSGATVLQLLRDIADRGQTIVMATHSPEAAKRCDRAIQLQDGRILA